MCTRPRRSALKQKDTSIDMLGLSRQEERMLQRAMYDSLRQHSQKGMTSTGGGVGGIKHKSGLLVKGSRSANLITTRSKTLSKLLISVSDSVRTVASATVTNNNSNNNSDTINSDVSMCCFSAPIKSGSAVVETERKLKRGTRYSPMRRLPLREMLKSLEDKKNQLNNDRTFGSCGVGGNGSNCYHVNNQKMVVVMGHSSVLTKRCSSSSSCGAVATGMKNEEISNSKSVKTVHDNVVRKPGRPKIMKIEPIESHPSPVKEGTALAAKLSSSIRSQKSPKTKRVPRTASLLARSSWMRSFYGSSQHSNSSSPTYPLAVRVTASSNNNNNTINCVSSASCNGKESGNSEKFARSRSDRRGAATVLHKRKKLIYNAKRISRSQRISRVILATATQRCKKARIKASVCGEKLRQRRHYHRLTRAAGATSATNTKVRSTKVGQDIKSTAVIPPELWLDPKGKPVNTEDFINFLIYKDTPYLDKSLKWFSLPPHKRKQRLYKIVPVESTKFNETVVFNEKREGGGREVVVQCQPPKLNDDSSELVSIDSDQTSLLEENKVKCPASVNSSCVTQAAVDEESSPMKRVNGGCGIKAEAGEKDKSCKVKKMLKSCPKSTHIMEIRKRKV